MSLLTLGFYVVALSCALISDNPMAGLSTLRRLREFLAAPLIGLLLLYIRITPRFLLMTVKLSAFIIFSVVYLQFLQGTERPGGSVNALICALISLLLGFFSLIRFPRESASGKLLSMGAFSAGFLASVLTQSRFVWALSILLLMAVLLVWRKAGCLTSTNAVGANLLLLFLVLAASQVPAVEQRLHSAYAEYHIYRTHSNWDSSVGRRIVMWKDGLQAAMEKPIFGWGAENTQRAAMRTEPDKEAMKQIVLNYNHLHNEYLTSLVARGIPGILSLLVLLFAPIVVFWRRLTRPDRLVFDGIGIILCSGYALSGLTNQAFGDDTLNMFYILFLALTLAD